MRTKLKTNVIISNDPDGKNLLFGFDDTLAEEITDLYTHCVSGKFTIAGGATDALGLWDITAVKGLYVKADAGFQFVMNGGADTFTSNAASATGSSRVFLQVDLSSFSITNLSATDALTGIWVAWGDPTT
ncbi:MAG: hypothetical protein CME17_01075 [Gemmatimonadetes bacterium]|nr:hypothetical protein [Gemmatimonadota bacterium]|tara:strand:- start:309 stop:698 length:390 start_codon:yes stop_codon:yes gene_type:complete